MLSQNDELILGPAYVDVAYDFGKNNSPTLIVGYRRYLFGNAHLEYQLWPAYNSFHDYASNTYFKGFDMWNEFRAGYKFDFTIGKLPMYLNLQLLFGFGLIQGNKPTAFIEHEKVNRFFTAPAFFIGFHL